MFCVVCACVGYVIEDFFAIETVPLGDGQQADGALSEGAGRGDARVSDSDSFTACSPHARATHESPLRVDEETLALSAAHVNG